MVLRNLFRPRPPPPPRPPLDPNRWFPSGESDSCSALLAGGVALETGFCLAGAALSLAGLAVVRTNGFGFGFRPEVFGVRTDTALGR